MSASDLKPVLVIDNRELFAPAGDFASLVVHMAEADITNLDENDYATAFVHDDNTSELNWARQHYPIYFKFTGRGGEFDEVTENKGAYKLPRHIFERYFKGFLAAYAEKGVVDKNVANTFLGF